MHPADVLATPDRPRAACARMPPSVKAAHRDAKRARARAPSARRACARMPPSVKAAHRDAKRRPRGAAPSAAACRRILDAFQ
jgi:hypothetical protein